MMLLKSLLCIFPNVDLVLFQLGTVACLFIAVCREDILVHCQLSTSSSYVFEGKLVSPGGGAAIVNVKILGLKPLISHSDQALFMGVSRLKRRKLVPIAGGGAFYVG